MADDTIWNEHLVEQNVTYHIEIDGQLLIVENVSARVNIETGERYFAPETVERLQCHAQFEGSGVPSLLLGQRYVPPCSWGIAP